MCFIEKDIKRERAPITSVMGNVINKALCFKHSL